MNCLQFALAFNARNPEYKIYYNSDHVINLKDNEQINGYLPLETFGIEHIEKSFAGVLYPIDFVRLRRYFNEK